MDLMATISDQMADSPLPLVAITVAAVPCPDTPVILTLHWHGFIENPVPEAEHGNGYTPVPSSALQVNDRWNDVAVLDRAAMEAGWELGAWDVARAQRNCCTRPGAELSESLACLHAFGEFPYGLNGQQVVVSSAPDAAELARLAGRRGYLMWMFRPVHGGIWAEVAEDATLRADGTRTPPCPLDPIPAADHGPASTVYRFGIPPHPVFLN